MMNIPIDSIICHDVAKPFPLPDNCIDVVITSPPYYGLRDYGVKSIFGGDPNCKHEYGEGIRKKMGGGKESAGTGTHKTGVGHFDVKTHFCQKCGAWRGQLGLEPHPQMFIDHLVIICQEIKRVLKKTGSFYLDIGDTYGGSGRGYRSAPDPKWKKARDGKLKPSKIYDGKWLQPKQLLLIPSRIAIDLQNDGWILRNDIIWHKPNPMPSSVKDRLNTTFEHVFHFVKQKKYYYDLDAIREPHKTESVTRYQHSMDGCFTPGKAYPNEKREKPQKWKLSDGGKNPSDVIEENMKSEASSRGYSEHSASRTVTHLHQVGKNYSKSELGKNPGDVIGGKFHVGDGYRQGMNRDENAFGIQLKNPPDPREIVDYLRKHKRKWTYKKIDQMLCYDGDCSSHWFTYPENKHGFSYPSSEDWMNLKELLGFDDTFDQQMTETTMVPQTITAHPHGGNPGDVIQFDEEYWWNFILGNAHSNRFYKKAFEIMKEWMVKNNCFDYEIFYEWYKKEFEGKWESGNLKKGKANYLSDEKRLPFPKPETRFLGDGPGDFWEICTQPFTGYNPELEHFAVFPELLVERPLKASCPQMVCKKCGKPQKKAVKSGGYDGAFNIRVRDVKEGRIKHTDRKASEKEVKNYDEEAYVSKVKKHVISPGCNCNAGFRHGVVLDPFCGRGTVGKVAKSLGLHYILFDIKPEYCKLSRLFIGGQKYKVHKTQMNLDSFA